ncbi:iron response transcriptional regulator IrrA [Agrobacterium radiobacter]|uniref:iron response transcriptional regulator IrrA n=1 Tax=Agrobacterium radiobacter TaxID=362 RepID=UPI003F87743F
MTRTTPSVIEQKLRRCGLRPTRQRIALAKLLFSGDERHVTVEELYAEANEAGINLSLATVYNTLHQMTDAGLLRVLSARGTKTYFDTNTCDHHHFFYQEDGMVVDVPHNTIRISNLPHAPDGTQISHVDVIIHLCPTKST